MDTGNNTYKLANHTDESVLLLPVFLDGYTRLPHGEKAFLAHNNGRWFSQKRGLLIQLVREQLVF